MANNVRPIEVICYHGLDGAVTPLRLRVKGVYVDDKTIIYECKIVVFGRDKQVRLYCDDPYLTWKMTP